MSLILMVYVSITLNKSLYVNKGLLIKVLKGKRKLLPNAFKVYNPYFPVML